MRIRLLAVIAMLSLVLLSPAWTADEEQKLQAGGPADGQAHYGSPIGQDDGQDGDGPRLRDEDQAFIDVIGGYRRDIAEKLQRRFEEIRADATLYGKAANDAKIAAIDKRREALRKEMAVAAEFGSAAQLVALQAVDSLFQSFKLFLSLKIRDLRILPAEVRKRLAELEADEDGENEDSSRGWKPPAKISNAGEDLQQAMDLPEDASAPYRRVSQLGALPGDSEKQFAYRIAVQDGNACVSKVFYVEEGSAGPGNISMAPQDGPGATSDSGLSVEEQAFIDVIRRSRPDIAGKIERKFSSIDAANLDPKETGAAKHFYLEKIRAKMLRELDAIVKLGGKEAAAAFLAVRNLLHEFAIYIFDPTDPLTTLPQEVKKRAAEIEAERRKTGSAPNGDSSYDGDDISMAPQDAASGAVSMDSDLPVVEQAFIDVIRDKGRGPQDDIADKIARKFAAIEALNLPPDQEKLEKVQYLDKIRQSLKEQRKIAEQVGTKEQVDAISVLVGLLADFLKFSMDPASLLPEDVAKRVAEIEAERRKAGGAPDGDSSDDGDDIALAPQITDNMAAAMGGDLSVEEEAFIDVIRDKRRGPNDDIAGKIARKFAAIEALNLPPEEETREKLQYLNKIHRDLQEQRNVALRLGADEKTDAISELLELVFAFFSFIYDPTTSLPQDVAKRAAEIETERMKAEGTPDGDSSNDRADISTASRSTMSAADGTGETGTTADGDRDGEDIGLGAKVTRQVLLLVRSGQTGKPVQNFVWKSIEEDPDLPVADAAGRPAETAASASTPADAYAADVTGGKAGDDGSVLLTTLTPTTANGRPPVTKNANGTRPITREVVLDREPMTRLVVGAQGQPMTQTGRTPWLPTVLDGLGFDMEVTAGYRIGDTSLLVVELPADQVAAFSEQVSRIGGIDFVELDPCRKKKTLGPARIEDLYPRFRITN